MTAYTSGKVSHDPEPWRVTTGKHEGRYSTLSMVPETHAMICEDPRPEFDNHNPILEAMRQELDCYASAADAAADWLHSIERGDHDETISDDKLAHARRVLTKLASLTTTPNGVTD